MGKKSGPKAPPPPDPYKVADAQGGINRDNAIREANLNRINQYTPGGSLTYNTIGTWEDGTPRYEQRVELAPEQQALYDQQNRVAQALGSTAENSLGRVNDTMGRGFNFDDLRANMMPDYQGGPAFMTSLPGQGGIQSTFGTGGPLTSNVQQSQFQDRIADAGALTRSAGGDFNETSRAAADATFSQLASRLDPQYQQLENDMRTRLINSGITENSEAFRREMDNFARQRTDAYNTASNQSVLTGLAAQNQGFGQSLSNANLNNAAQGQQFGQNAAQLDAFNTARANEFSQGMANANLNNTSQAQQFSQNLGAAAFGNEAQNQQFGQDLAGATFRNTALGQQDDRNWQRSMGMAAFNNDLRQREIQEATYLRNLPINDIAALLGTGGGVQAPNFAPVPQTQLNSPDLMGAVYNSYNAQMQQWQQAQQNRSAGLGSIFGLAGTLGAAAISDKRLKHSIKRVGELANGVATYVFSYLGDTARHFGVMAQEVINVIPDAVGVLNNGTYYVDYRKVGL